MRLANAVPEIEPVIALPLIAPPLIALSVIELPLIALSVIAEAVLQLLHPPAKPDAPLTTRSGRRARRSAARRLFLRDSTAGIATGAGRRAGFRVQSRTCLSLWPYRRSRWDSIGIVQERRAIWPVGTKRRGRVRGVGERCRWKSWLRLFAAMSRLFQPAGSFPVDGVEKGADLTVERGIACL